MLNPTVGGDPVQQLQMLQQLLLWSEPKKNRKTRIQGVRWLDEPKAKRNCAPSDRRSWTCPRCRSHRCIRTNPGDCREAVYCCAVCGYTFHAATSTRLRSSTS